MTFIEIKFIIFLLFSFGVFYLTPVKHRWKTLLGVSILFYALASVKYLPFIFVTSFSVYLGGRQMGKVYQTLDGALQQTTGDKKQKKALKEQAKQKCHKILLLLLVINVGILCIVKYTKFFVNPINDLILAIGGSGEFTAASIIVPLGISYYTFSSLSYLLDVYWKRIGYEENYFRFLLYVIYFPHILQGPIERYGRLGQRLKEELRFDYPRIISGIQLMLWGYIKKLVIADRLDIFITAVYKQTEVGGLLYIIAIFLDVVYIYADFSGCMDIARGASAIFGVELDLNFNHPFSAKSVTEFWRRWHMSLGSWFKDYVYYPVSTSRLVKDLNKTMRDKCSPRMARGIVTAIPVTVTWMLTGIWHGTGRGYIVWGMYYAFMIFMSVTFGEDFHNLAVRWKINQNAYSWKFFQMFRTTCIFAGGRLLTRPGYLRRTLDVVIGVLTKFNPWVLFDGTLYNYGLDMANFILALAFTALFGFVSHMQQRGSVRGMIARQNLVLRWIIYLAAIFAIFIFGIYGPGYSSSSFVYMAY